MLAQLVVCAEAMSMDVVGYSMVIGLFLQKAEVFYAEVENRPLNTYRCVRIVALESYLTSGETAI